MAIGYARLEFVQRSAGKTACGKAAYISRERIHFYGNQFSEPKTYDWSYKEKPAYHEILLPQQVNEKFKSLEVLWNTVEKMENRHNSQVAMEMVLALPDDQVISLDDRIELTKSFVEEYFVKNGFGAQISIHSPDKKIQLSIETGEINNLDHNWHAHILTPTRRFKDNGLELEIHKARDLMPAIRNGKVIAGPNWGKLWTQHQNEYFEENGLDLRVDENGIISQKHLGPIRMRGRAFALEEENQALFSLNQMESKDPAKILTKITETRSVFTTQDIERFLKKHIDAEFIDVIREEFWKQESIVQLHNPINKEPFDKFSTLEIIEEERQILRLADKIHRSSPVKLQSRHLEKYTKQLNQEQKFAFNQIIQGKKLSCIEGHAGAGKSYLLSALRDAYQSQGYTVRAFGPDNATTAVLKEKGFDSSENIYRFMFSLHHAKKDISKGKEIWILDESSKLGNRPLLEFLKLADKHQTRLIFAGCSSQLPSVERGGFFKTLCNRYGAEELIEIQRQKKLEQREMAKNLACGKMAVAIDQLVKLHGIKWSETKNEAIENLIKAWAVDQTLFPTSSSLILAHTNSEVRILNEMARLYLRDKGQLEEAEYICKALDGKKIIVSVGDKIEFRKNDNEFGIKNGMKGTLVEASPNCFVVTLQDNSRKIPFNPEKYTGFQLGYATTYHRSQGQTLDRVYVLHSPQMNKEKFYVTLTRHSHKVYLYASQEEVSCIADLKRQAFRRTPIENTLNYTTEAQLKQREAKQDRAQAIEQLKGSSLMVKKIKGYVFDSWDLIKEKVQEYQQFSRDLRPSQEFFNPDLKREDIKGQVVKIKDEYLDYEQRQRIQRAFGKISDKIETPRSIQHSNQIQQSSWGKLSEQNKSLLNQYFQSLNQTSILYSLIRSEVKGNNIKSSSYFKEWQMKCSTRNNQAYDILKSCSQGLIREAIGKEAFQILQERALRHEVFLDKQNDLQIDLAEDLKEHIEPLLYRLFPVGPTSRDSRGFRFGSHGSLSVICKGEEIGSFYDFEKGIGGGPLKLVQHVLNLDNAEARKWAQDFLGNCIEIKSPAIFKFKPLVSDQKQEWKSLKPDSNYPAPQLSEISSSLSRKYLETARHAYLDEKGELLFYVLRLADKEDSTKKNIRPLSFGYWQGAEKPCWSLKNYQDEKRSLYHLEQLYKKPLAKVLVVEGEKTADASQTLFANREIICVTWQGGSSAVLKSDWMPLCGREVIIWPDNDAAGFKAADQLCSILRKVGVKSLSLIDKEELIKNFPEKWDLADPFPKSKSLNLKDMMLTAKEKSMGIDRLRLFFKGNEKELNIVHAHEIVWRLEERLWSSLEEKHGNQVWKIKQEIFDKAQRLLSEQSILEKRLQTQHLLSPELSIRMAKQLTLQESENGKIITANQIEELKRVMMSITQVIDKNNQLAIYSIDKSLTEALNLEMRSEILSKHLINDIDESSKKIMAHEKMREDMHNIKQKNRGIELDF